MSALFNQNKINKLHKTETIDVKHLIYNSVHFVIELCLPGNVK